MSNYGISGIHLINRYIWHRLQQAGIMSATDYNGLVPFIPAQQVSVFTEMPGNPPFIVYSYMTSAASSMYWNAFDQISYTIYDNDEGKIRQIQNYMFDLLKRLDITAQEVNDYLWRPENTDGLGREFDFKSIAALSSISPDPALSDHGRQGGMITARASYTYNPLIEEGKTDYSMR